MEYFHDCTCTFKTPVHAIAFNSIYSIRVFFPTSGKVFVCLLLTIIFRDYRNKLIVNTYLTICDNNTRIFDR